MTHVAITVFNTVFDCCWFLCILLVCDICCLCGLINTLINDCIGLLSCWLLQQSLCHCTRYYYCRHCHYAKEITFISSVIMQCVQSAILLWHFCPSLRPIQVLTCLNEWLDKLFDILMWASFYFSSPITVFK